MRWPYVAYGVAPLLAAAALVLWTYESGLQARLATTSGTITRAALETMPGRGTYYRLEVGYRYEAGGQSRTGTRVGLAQVMYDGRESAEEELRRWSIGQAVTVYYDPDAPDDAYLDPDGMTNGAGLSVLAGLYVVLAYPIIWLVRRQSTATMPGG